MESWNSYRKDLKENDDMEGKLAQFRDRRKADHMKDAETTGMDATDDLEMEDDLYKELVVLLKDRTDSKALIADFMDRYERDMEFKELYGQDLYDYMNSPEYQNSAIHGGDEEPDF
jgi:hypothetical protein